LEPRVPDRAAAGVNAPMKNCDSVLRESAIA
jgi:hypothetical protein